MMYSIIITSTLIILILILGIKYYNEKSKTNSYISHIEQEIYKRTKKIDDNLLDQVKKIEEIKKIKTPWYEKQISVIGTAAFIGMALGTSIQLYETYQKEKKLENIKEKIKELEKTENKLSSYLKIASKEILISYRQGKKLTQNEATIIKWHLNEKKQKNNNDLQIILEIMMATASFDDAKKLLEENKELLKTTNEHTIISLAELFYINNHERESEKILDNIIPAKVPRSSSIRYYSLKWLTTGDKSTFKNLSKKLGIKEEKAIKKIDSYSNQLEKAKRQLNNR